MGMDGIPFTRVIWWGLTFGMFWPPWLLAVAAFVLSRKPERRVLAFGLLVTGIYWMLLALVLGTIPMLLNGDCCYGGCRCPAFQWYLPHILPVAWAPMVIFGTPVLLRTFRNGIDRSMRHAITLTGAAIVDVMAVTFGMAYILSTVCPRDHGVAWLLGL